MPIKKDSNKKTVPSLFVGTVGTTVIQTRWMKRFSTNRSHKKWVGLFIYKGKRQMSIRASTITSHQSSESFHSVEIVLENADYKILAYHVRLKIDGILTQAKVNTSINSVRSVSCSFFHKMFLSLSDSHDDADRRQSLDIIRRSRCVQLGCHSLGHGACLWITP